MRTSRQNWADVALRVFVTLGFGCIAVLALWMLAIAVAAVV